MSYTTLGQTMMVSAPTLSTRTAPLPCITAAEKAKAELDCRIPDVKGLGFTYGTNTRFSGQDACAVARLPVCATPTFTLFRPPPPAPVAVRTDTVAPMTPTVVSSLRLPPNIVAVPPPPVPVPQEKKAFFGLGVGGLIAVLAVGGGAAYYFTRKKKGAAA